MRTPLCVLSYMEEQYLSNKCYLHKPGRRKWDVRSAGDDSAVTSEEASE